MVYQSHSFDVSSSLQQSVRNRKLLHPVDCLFLFLLSSNNKTLSEILLELQSSLEENETTLINVRRGAIWTDTCRQMTRKRFSPRRNISVKFADSEGNSEGAVDVGGPKREFLRLAVRAANLDSGVFIGPEGCRTLYANSMGTSFLYIVFDVYGKTNPYTHNA